METPITLLTHGIGGKPTELIAVTDECRTEIHQIHFWVGSSLEHTLDLPSKKLLSQLEQRAFALAEEKLNIVKVIDETDLPNNVVLLKSMR